MGRAAGGTPCLVPGIDRMTSPLPHLSTILAEPDVARLMAEPGPWWLWTADASRLLVANTTGARAMGAGGLAAALDRDYSTTHAFAAQIARLAPTLPADGTPRSERLRIAGRFGSESVVAEAFRLRAGTASLIAVRLPSMRQGSARDAALGLVATLRVPALAFDRAGRPLAASEEASAVAETPLADLVGPAAGPLFDSLATEGRATVDLVNGPMTVLALPNGDVLVALLAPLARAMPEAGLRLVAGGAPAVPEADALPAAEPAAAQPAAADQAPEEAAPEETSHLEPAETGETPSGPTDSDLTPSAERAASDPAIAAVAEPLAGETSPDLAEEPPAAQDDATVGAPSSDPAPAAVEHDTADDRLAPPQRFSWRMDADYRFHTIAPDEVAAPAGETFAAAVDRFGLDPQGTFTAAVTALRPFSGVPALWPLGGGRRRLAVTLAAFPTLRDGVFQGYAGFGLVVEEAAPAAPQTPAAEPDAREAGLDEAIPATGEPDAADGPAGEDVAAVPETHSCQTEPSPADLPEDDSRALSPTAAVQAPPAAVLVAGEEEVGPAADDQVETAAAPRNPAEKEPVSVAGATAEPMAAEPVADEVVATDAAEPHQPEPHAPVDPDQPSRHSAEAGEDRPAVEPETMRPAAETRPVLTVHTNPPNVVALRTSVGQDIKRPQLSPGERNAFREIARALGARTDDALPTDPAGARTPDPLPPPAEQSVPPAPMDEPVAEAAEPVTAEPVAEAEEPTAEAMDLPQTASPATAGEAPAKSFVDSGTPFGPLPSAFGTEPSADGSGQGADLAALLDKVPTGLIVHRGNAVLFVNRTLLDWVGFADAATLEEAGGVSRLFAGGTENGGESVTLTTADGRDIPVEAHLSRVTWAGQSAFLFTLARASVADAAADQESATLSELRGRLEEVEQILDTATDGIVIVTSDGAIESMNRSAEALFGYESAEVKGLSVTTLFAPESHRSALDYCDGLLSNGVASVLNDGRQIIGRVKQGGLIPLYMTMGRTGPAARPKLAAVFRDMTNWKKAEEDLIAAKRQAEQASSQKSDFLAKISHEIRTPLNAIIGFSEVMMEERFGPVGNERYRDYLKDIHASGGHVLSLINDLLDLSKIEAGKLELAFTSVDLNDMVQSTVAIMQPQANRERVIIRSSLQPRLPNVVADSRSLRQIVLNLLSNSVKFTPAGGQIIVSTGLSDAGEAVLRVRDTGVGMTEAELKAAMEPFRQVATSSPRAAKGTGLGLPLTKALVEANRASFGISSTPNQGTLVEVVFPPTRVLAE
jgi:PAS domain S-box-containing protein